MQVNLRREQRRKTNAIYTLTWQNPAGATESAVTAGVDISSGGLRVRSSLPIGGGTPVYLQGQDGNICGYATVRSCLGLNDWFEIGIEFTEDLRTEHREHYAHDVDFYEFLQISPRAESSTIQRVYRFMAGRFHPDNPETGDPEKFLLLNRAYSILSDATRRAAYDASRDGKEVKPNPIFELREFVNGIEGETNRRLGVLSLLYNQRRTNPENPRVSLHDLEKRMGWPREYLDFTTWYLRSKLYITREDNSDFSLTALGVDFVESNYTQIPMLNKLLNSGSRTATSASPSTGDVTERDPSGLFLMNPADSHAASTVETDIFNKNPE